MPASTTIVNLEIRIKELEKQLNTTNEKLKSVGVQGKRAGDQVNQSFDKVKQTVGKFAAYFGAVIGGAAVVGAIKKSIDAMKEFEQTFTNVLTLLSDAERRKFGAFLKQGSIDLMKNYGFAIEDVNKALFDSISAGIKAGDSIKFMNEAAKLAKGGVTSLSVAVDGMTSIMNAYGLAANDAEKVSSAFFTAQKYGKTTVEQLASSIGRLAPIAKDAGVSYQEMLSALALLTQQGISTDEAVTGLRATIVALTNPAAQAQKTLKTMGIESGKTAIRQNGLGKTLLDVAKAAETDADKLGEMIPNVRALTAVAALGEEALAEYDNILKDVNEDYGEGSSLAQAYRLQAETLANSVERIKGQAKAAKIALGDFLAPLVKGFADLIAPVEKTSTALIKQRTELNLLVGAITNTSNTEESRLRLIEKLNAEYPDFLEGLDTEKVTNEELNTVLAETNELYEQKIKLAVAQEIYNIQAAKLAELTLEESKLLIQQEKILDRNADKLLLVTTGSKELGAVKALAALGLVAESNALATNLTALDENRAAQEKFNEQTQKSLELISQLASGLDGSSGAGGGDGGGNVTDAAKAAGEAIINYLVLPLQDVTSDMIYELFNPEDTQAAMETAFGGFPDYYEEAWQQFLDDYRAKEEEQTLITQEAEEKRRAIIQATWDSAFNLVDAFSKFNQAAMNRELAEAEGNEKKQEEIRKKYARKEQLLSIARTIMAGAEGIVQTGKNLGYPLAIPFQIAQAIQTAAQIALISSQKFAKGGYEVLGGERHAQGGTMIPIGEAERGEGHAVFSRWATEKYGRLLPDLVDAINKGSFPQVDMDVNKRMDAGQKLMKFMHTVSLDDSKQLEEIKKLLSREREQVSYMTDAKGDKYKIVQKKGYFKKMRIR